MSQQISVERFLCAAKPQFDRLEAFYRRSQFVGIATTISSECGTEVMQHTYRANGAHLRVDTLAIEPRKSSSRTWSEWSRVATPHMGFHASRGEGEAAFVLREFSKDSSDTDNAIRWKFPFASSTYQFRDETLWDFLSHPSLKITSCVATKRNRENVIYLECEREDAVATSFTFSVDKAWAMVEFETKSDEKRDCIHVSYEMVNGYPIVRRLDDYHEYDNGDVPLRTIVEVSDFIPAPAPLDYFDMSALGIHGALPVKDFST